MVPQKKTTVSTGFNVNNERELRVKYVTRDVGEGRKVWDSLFIISSSRTDTTTMNVLDLTGDGVGVGNRVEVVIDDDDSCDDVSIIRERITVKQMQKMANIAKRQHMQTEDNLRGRIAELSDRMKLEYKAICEMKESLARTEEREVCVCVCVKKRYLYLSLSLS